MPSLPAVMNELMSYTVTPIRVVSLLASVSPAPHAVMPNPSAPADAIAAILVVSLIYALFLVSEGKLRLILSGDALVGDVPGLEVLGGLGTEAVEELLPVADDVLVGDVDVVLGDRGHDVDRLGVDLLLLDQRIGHGEPCRQLDGAVLQ